MTIVQNSPGDPTARTNQQPEFYPDPYEVQYQHATEPSTIAPFHRGHDDDFGTVLPSTTFACTGPENGNLPSQPPGVMNMISVKPIPHDPNDVEIPQRMVQVWASLDHPSGINNIDDVYWKIYEPVDGHPDNWKFKIKVHGTRVGDLDSDIIDADPYIYNSAGQIIGCCRVGGDHDNDNMVSVTPPQSRLVEECKALGDANLAGSMFEAARHTGQVSPASIDDLNLGMTAKCAQAEKAIYYAKFSIDKDQACGKYKIVAHAVSNGAESTMINYIDVVCFTYMSLDFDEVKWGMITPGIMQVVSGDFGWDDALDFVEPGMLNPHGASVHNGGNHPMGIKIKFTELLLLDAAGNPVPGAATNGINKFDACFGKYNAGNIVCVGRGPTIPPALFPADVIEADEWTLFGPGGPSGLNPTGQGHDNGYQVLCANEIGKLDLSIHPRDGLPNGTYAGTVTVMSYEAHNPDSILSTVPPKCEEDGPHVTHP
jgi:hypothetical protein